MAKQNQLPRLAFNDMPPQFVQHYQQLIDTVNSLQGYNGPAVINGHIDLKGNRLMNVGAPENPTDAISHGVAQAQYSAQALRPQLEANGAQPLQTPRRLNDTYQREQSSTYMNDVLSVTANANTIIPTFTNGAGVTTINIPSNIFQFADGTKKSYPARSDTVSNPSNFAIASWSVTGLTATIVTTLPNTVAVDQTIALTGTGGLFGAGIDGQYSVDTVLSPTSFEVTVSVGGSGTAGSVETASVYYYYVIKQVPIIQVLGVPALSDTPFERLPTSIDGQQLVCVAFISSTGGSTPNSAGGGTPTSGSPNAGSFF